MPFEPKRELIALDTPRAGGLVHSVGLAEFGKTSTDPIRMFARRDAFRTVAEFIAESIAGVPFNLYQRNEQNGRKKLYADEHPVAGALDSPAPGTTQFRLVEGVMLDQVLHDRWAIFLHDDVDAGLQLIRMPAQWVKFAVDGFRRITHVVVTIPGDDSKAHPIPANECLFDVGWEPSPSKGFAHGYPISHTLEASAAELDQGAAYRRALLAGGPKVPMYIKRPADAADWIRNGGRARFIESFKAYSNERAGEVPILEDGMEMAAAPQLVAKDVDYQAARLAAQIEFAIAMHIPPEIIGYRPGTFSNLESFREQVYVDVLGGRITAFRQAVNAGLRRAGRVEGGYYVEENIGARLASAPEKQAGILQTQVGAPVRTVNEARRMLNLPPVDGGDELIVPLNVVKGGLASPTDTGPKADVYRVVERPAIEGKAATPAAYKATVEKQRDRFANDLRKAFVRQSNRVRAVLGSDSSPGPLEDAFDLDLENEELASVIYPHSVALAAVGASVVLDRYNPDRDNFSEDVMYPWLQKAAAGTANMINKGTLSSLASSIFGPDWQKDTADLFGRLAGEQADVWAQTVTTTSTNFGSADAAKASNLTNKTWRQTSSKEPRSEHSALDGETVPANETFSNGMRWPGDPTGGATENANCHCRVEYSRTDE